MNFLLSHKELKTLNVEREKYSDIQFPKITGDILELANLECLRLTYNVDIDSFLNKLGQIEGSLNLKTLEFFDYLMEINFQYFVKTLINCLI